MSSAVGSMVSLFGAGCPVIITSLLAVVPSTTVRTRLRLTLAPSPSSVNSSGFHSAVYRTMHPSSDGVDRRTEASGAGDRPAIAAARQRDLFRPDRHAAQEDREVRRARLLQRRRHRRLRLGRYAASGTASASAMNAARIEWSERMPQHSTMIPAVSAGAYDAARHRAAFVDRSDRGRIVVSGADRASYLQGLLTNDIVALKPGQGCYAAYLTAQGRMIADLHVYELGDVMLLAMAGDVKDARAGEARSVHLH